MKSKLLNYFNSGGIRSQKIKKNVIVLFIFRGISLLASFILVPIAINYIDSLGYGIWLTILSFITWFQLFQLGLGQGLQNKLGEALAKGNYKLARIYVSTTFFIVSLIFLSIILIFLILNHFIDWASIFNAPVSYKAELHKVMFFVFLFFGLRFIFKITLNIFLANQEPALSQFFELIGRILSLITIYVLSRISEGSLFYLTFIYSLIPVLVLLFAMIYAFTYKYKKISPAIRYIDLKYVKDLMGLSFLFFINSICTIILFSTDNIIISHISGPAMVTPYALSRKYFLIIFIFFDSMTLPLWSAFTDAYAKGDFSWIKRVVKKTIVIWKYAFLAVILMLFFSPVFFKIWVGEKVSIPFTLSLLMAIHVIQFTYVNVYSRFLNGVSKIRLATYYSFLSAAINIPLSIFLAKTLGMGIHGVIIATIICMLPPVLSHPIQYNKIIQCMAKGVWNK